jgi:hypothetical protein
MVELVGTARQAAAALPVTRAGQALALSRATYYRWQTGAPMPDQHMGLRTQ